MRTVEKVCVVLVFFFFGVGTLYGMWGDWREPLGTTALYLSGGLSFMIAWYLWITRRQLEVDPSDNPVGEIEDIQGDYGFFAPHSWWPLWLALSAATIFAGLAIGWWLFVIGAVLAVPALIGWTFEFWKGPHAL